MENLHFSKGFVVGLKQTKRALENGDAERVYIAYDADPNLLQEIIAACEAFSVPVCQEMDRKELGNACHISVGAATCAILKD